MQEAMKTWPSWEYENPLKNMRQDTLPPDEGAIAPSDVFSHLAFKNKPRDAPKNGPISGDIAYLRPVDQTLEQEYPETETLRDHPIAWRTFATFPPVDMMVYDSPLHMDADINKTGVIAGDTANSFGISCVSFLMLVIVIVNVPKPQDDEPNDGCKFSRLYEPHEPRNGPALS